MTLPLTVIVASPCAAVVIGVGSFAPLRNATNRSGAGGIEVSPTSSLQLPTASSSANVPPPNTRRPRIANLLTVWGSARPKTALGIPAPRGLFKRPFLIELSGRRQADPPATASDRSTSRASDRGSTIQCFHLTPDRRLETSRLDHDHADAERQQLASHTVRDR